MMRKLLVLTCAIVFLSGLSNAFVFNGTVMDADGNALNNTFVNITISAGMPPSPIGYNHTYTNESGWFNLTLPGNSNYMYKPVITHRNSTGQVDYVGQSLPEFPYEEFSTVSDTNFYLRRGATLNITAVNSSGGSVSFTYGIYDTKLGFPIKYSYEISESNVLAYVPADRNYSIEIGEENNAPGFYEVNNISDYSEPNPVIDITYNATITPIEVTGRFNLTNGTGSFDSMNMIAYLLEPGNMIFGNGMVPIESSSFENASGTYTIGNLPSSPENLDVLMLAIGKIGDQYYGAYRNLSTTFNTNVSGFNFTLHKMLGSLGNISVFGENVTVGLTQFNLTSSDVTGDISPHVEVTTDYSGLNMSPEGVGGPEFTRMVFGSDVSSSAFQVPLLNYSIKEMNILVQGGLEPKRLPITKSALQDGQQTIELNSFNPATLGGTSGSDISVEIHRSNSTCDQPGSHSECVLQSTNGDDFDPLGSVIGGGKLNFVMGMGDVLVKYVNVDLIASGPPGALFDSNSDVDEQTQGSFSKAMRFGSSGPTIYDYVMISMPYTEGNSTSEGLYESNDIDASVPLLYGEDSSGSIDWSTPIWNATANDTSGLGGNYSHYSSKNSEWSTLLSGSTCTENASAFNSTSPCFINKTENRIWLRLPHFSGTSGELSGSATPLNITLNSPGNGSTMNSSSLNLNYTVNKEANCTVYLWNSTSGVLENSTFARRTGTSWVALSKVNGTYSWNVYCTASNNASDTAWGSADYNYTFTINDVTAPNVTATSPSGEQSSSTTSVTLSATTDEYATCKYDTSDAAYENLSSSLSGSGTSHTASKSVSSGSSYTYYVRCKDINNHTNNESSTISFSVASGSTSGGGGGGTATEVTTTVLANETNATDSDGDDTQLDDTNQTETTVTEDVPGGGLPIGEGDEWTWIIIIAILAIVGVAGYLFYNFEKAKGHMVKVGGKKGKK